MLRNFEWRFSLVHFDSFVTSHLPGPRRINVPRGFFIQDGSCAVLQHVAVQTMMLLLNFSNALYSQPDDDIDLGEAHSVFLEANKMVWMNEEAMVTSAQPITLSDGH